MSLFFDFRVGLFYDNEFETKESKFYNRDKIEREEI